MVALFFFQFISTNVFCFLFVLIKESIVLHCKGLSQVEFYFKKLKLLINITELEINYSDFFFRKCRLGISLSDTCGTFTSALQKNRYLSANTSLIFFRTFFNLKIAIF